MRLLAFPFAAASTRSVAVRGFAALACLLPIAAVTQSPAPAPATVGIGVAVIDPAGAKVAHAEVLVFFSDDATGASVKKAETDRSGQVTIALPAGTYQVQVSAKGFSTTQQTVTVQEKRTAQVTVKLAIQTTSETVNVTGEDTGGDGTVSNGEALVLRGDVLRTLSDNPSMLQQQLNALVGSEDAPQLRIDGFSGGRLPPKSAIREVRINQNAYSAQFDLSGNSILEIFTKPGSDKLHSYFFMEGNWEALNERNPYIARQPGYHTLWYEGDMNGSLTKNTSFSIGSYRQDLQTNAAINATVLDSGFTPVPFSQAVPYPSVSSSYNARIDHQFGANNTFTGRFDFSNEHQVNSGIGQLVLASQGFTTDTKTSTLQLGDTTIFGPHVVAESRFQYLRTRSMQSPASNAPTLTVQGAFNGGGSSGQTYRDAQDNYEWQEYLSIDRGKHFLRTGLRYRLTRDSNSSTAGYNGSYTFPSIEAYQATLRGMAAGQTPAQIRAAGGGASQYYVTAGTPSAILTTGDLGVYFEDEWKLRPTFSLTSGLRYESQYAIPDHSDPAPRLGFSWQITRKKGTVPVVQLNGGIGVFYQRFPANNLLIADRQNGVLQRSYYLQNPDFYPNAPVPEQLSSIEPTIYQVAPDLRSPYVLSEGIGANRQLSNYGNVGVNISKERGVHQFLSRNANAPLNGTRPLGGTQNVYQYASLGTSNTSTFSAHALLRFKETASVWGSYSLRFRDTIGGGLGGFVSNSYNPSLDYGRTGFVTRHRLYLGLITNLPFHWYLQTFLAAHSSTRFNITTGQDNNGDSIFNDRPAFATDLTRASVVRTAFGNFDTAPVAGQKIIPVNYGVAPGYSSVQMKLGRNFAFGPPIVDAEAPKPQPGAKAQPPDRLYKFELGLESSNIFNQVNPSTPVGQLTSPQFGRSLTLNTEQSSNSSANRVVNLFVAFHF